jgi:hypothetical protein
VAVFGSEILEVAAGLTFFFLLVSLMCTALMEAFEGVLRRRAKSLEQAIETLLSDPELAGQIYRHPLISGLFLGDYPDPKVEAKTEAAEAKAKAEAATAKAKVTKADSVVAQAKGAGRFRRAAASVAGAVSDFLRAWGRRPRLPAYIPTPLFAAALIDQLVRTSGKANAAQPPRLDMPALREAARVHKGKAAGQVLSALVNMAGSDVASVQKGVEAWFDGAMDRVSGRYKLGTQTMLFWTGLIAAAALNLDAITVVQSLSRDRALREAALAQAEHVAPPAAPGSGAAAAQAEASVLSNRIREIGFPVGWRAGWPKPQSEPRVDAHGRCVASAKAPTPLEMAAADKYSRTERIRRALKDGLASQPDSQGCRYELGWKVAPMLLGWLATALAVMLGAPFWFDMLNRIMIVRSTVKPDQKSPPEAPPEGFPPGVLAHSGPGLLGASTTDNAPPVVRRDQ